MLQPGDHIDRFQVEALLGEGGLAKVYLVRHRTLGARMALKVLTLRGSAIGRRLLREGRIQANLSHPHVVAVHDVIEHDGYTALVMEYVEGLTLGELLQRGGALSEADALALFGQLLSGVIAAHDLGVLHRDLKPANVLISATPMGTIAKIADFGIARVWDGEAGDTLQGDLIGTPGYMAPEQVTDPTAVDARADVYSLGALLYCMVAGRPPFLPAPRWSQTLEAAQRGDFAPIRALAPELSENVAAVIERCLQPDPAARPADGRALAVALWGEGSPAARAVAGAQAPAQPLDLSAPLSRPTLAPAAVGERGGLTPNPNRAPTPAPTPGGGAPTAVPSSWSGPASQPSAPPTPVPAPAPPPTDTPAPEPTPTPRPAPAPAAAEAPSPAPEAAPPPPTAPARPAVSLAGYGVLALLLIGLGLGAARWFAAAPAPPAPAPTAAVPAPTTASPVPGPASTAAPIPAGPTSADPVPAAPLPGPAPQVPSAAPPTASPAAPRPAGAPLPAPAAAPRPSPTASAAPAPAATPQPTPSPEPSSAPAPSPAPTAAPAPAPAPTPAPSADGNADASAVPAAPPTVAGSYAGKWLGRPITLTLSQRAGGKVSGRIEVQQGQGMRSLSFSGVIEPGGRLLLREAEEGWTLQATFANGQLSGMISQPDSKKPSPFTASIQ